LHPLIFYLYRMNMSSFIECPHCHQKFAMEEAVSEQYKKDLREQMITFTKKKEEEFQYKTADFNRQLQQQQDQFSKKLMDEKRILQQTVEENLRKSIAADFETKLQLLEQANRQNQVKLKEAQEKELAFLQQEQALKTREAELEISIHRKMQEERSKITEEVRKLEEQRNAVKETEHQFKLKELEKQLEVQVRLAEEMQRKAEQGSMQLQGEVQELALEKLLQSAFPFDLVQEVGKGVRGADCIQTVRNNTGQECGRIIYESKRTENFAADWIEKLKADMRSQGAQVAVLVTKTMPRDMDCFGEKNGIWICSFPEVKALTYILRDGIIRIFNAATTQQNKGDKMQFLYDYLTSSEFTEQWKAVSEGFMSMKISIQRERDMMEKLWKTREKQLEKVLLNAAHIKGSVEGIAGQDSIQMNLLDE
jgi:hypothetical protein